MLKFDRNKKKKIKFAMELDGIDGNLLEYYIRLSSSKMDYGFKGVNNNNILEFEIPALGVLLTETELNDLSNVKIEVHDKQNQYYLLPYQDEIEFEQKPVINTKIDEQVDTKVKLEIKLIDTDEKVKKESKLSKFIEN